MFWGSTAEQEAVEGMLTSFEGTLPEDTDLTVEALYTPDDYDTKLNALVASNRMPDVAYIQNAMAYRLAEQGNLLDLAPHFDAYPGIGERIPSAYNYWSDTQTFGTPAALEIICLFTNKAAFAEAGIDVPPVTADGAWDWDAFVEAAYRLTVDQNGRRPDEDGFDTTQVARFGTLANMWSGAWYGLLLSNGVDVVDESGTTTQLNSPEAVQVFQNLVDLMHVHRVAPSPTQLGNNAPSTPAQLASDRLGMAIDGQWNCSTSARPTSTSVSECFRAMGHLRPHRWVARSGSRRRPSTSSRRSSCTRTSPTPASSACSRPVSGCRSRRSTTPMTR